jgi:hypothetical protein
MRAAIANERNCPNKFVVDDVGNVLQKSGDHDSDILSDN